MAEMLPKANFKNLSFHSFPKGQKEGNLVNLNIAATTKKAQFLEAVFRLSLGMTTCSHEARVG